MNRRTPRYMGPQGNARTAFVLSGPTGRRDIVDTLPAAWEAAGRMLGRAIDPLDPALIARMAERAGR